MNTATNWTPGLVVLGFGIFGAAVYLMTARRLKVEAPRPETTDDLQAKYDSLLIELKEHHANKHLLPATEWEVERTRLEMAAAAVLRERSNLKHEAQKAEARSEKLQTTTNPDAGFFGRNPALKGGLVGGGIVAFFVFLGMQLSSQSKPREDGMQATGMVPPGASAPMKAGPPAEDTQIPILMEAIKKSPDDADALANLSMYMIRKQAFDEARPFVQRGTLVDPFHVRTRVARTILQAVDGSTEEAEAELERLGTLYPDGYDGLMYAGLIAIEANDSPRAIRNLEAYLAVAPPSEAPPFLRMALAQLRQQPPSP